LAIAGFCFIGGAIGKSAQVPLHVWLPDAMEAPTTISALIHAATMVNAGVYLMARSLPLFSSVAGWTTTLMWIGGITAFLAATMALVEPDLKRVLAYSTVSQLGYMMFGLGLGFTGFAPATYHLLVHAVGKALLFLAAGAVIHSVSTRNMYQMGGLKKEMKLTYITMIIGALSIAGLIPLSGFWSKDMILGAAWTTGNYIPFLLMIVTGVLTAAYMIRMLNLVFWGSSRRQTHAHEAPWQMTGPLVILAIGTLVVWLGVGYLTRSYTSFSVAFTFSVLPLSLISFIEETLVTLWWVAGASLLAFLLGVGLFYMRKSYAKNKVGAVTITVAQKGYGFDLFYGAIITCLRGFAARFRKIQTGDLNYNIAGIILGFLLLILFIFFLGGF
jgi:NADH-quinone oxidoreductase subunit L